MCTSGRTAYWAKKELMQRPLGGSMGACRVPGTASLSGVGWAMRREAGDQDRVKGKTVQGFCTQRDGGATGRVLAEQWHELISTFKASLRLP